MFYIATCQLTRRSFGLEPLKHVEYTISKEPAEYPGENLVLLDPISPSSILSKYFDIHPFKEANHRSVTLS